MPAVNPAQERRFELRELWRTRVDDYATALGFSADGAECAVGSASGDLRVLDARSGQARWATPAHEGGVLALAWSPRAGMVASAGQDGRARIYSYDGSCIAELPGSAAWVELVAWSPDGSLLATASGKTVRLWRPDGAPAVETPPHDSTVTGIAWGRSGRQLATCSYGGIRLWDVASGALVRELPWKGSLISIAWSPDEAVIAAASQDCSVHFWRLPEGQDSQMTGYPFKPRALAWDARSSLLATAGDATITGWDFSGRGPEGSTPLQLEGHRTLVTHLAFSPRKAVLASAAKDGTVLVWQPRRATTTIAYGFLEDEASGLAWHPEHRSLVAIDATGNVACWYPPG